MTVFYRAPFAGKTLFSILIVLISLGLFDKKALADEQSANPVDPLFLSEAVNEILNGTGNRADLPEPVASDATVDTSKAPLGSPQSFAQQPPPAGASHHSDSGPATVVEESPQRLKRNVSKPLPSMVDGYQSNSLVLQKKTTEDWRRLSFASSSFTPDVGVDPSLLQAAAEIGPGALQANQIELYTYGFILMDEYISDEIEQELHLLGVTLLGPHSEAYKAKIPLDLETLNKIAALPYVEWVGYSLSEQKLSAELQVAKAADANLDVQELPIIINLFDADPAAVFYDQLEAAGAIVGQYDPELLAYRAVATPEVIQNLIELDFVLYIELVMPAYAQHSESTPLIGADYIRPGLNITNGRYDGSPIIVGIMDSGFALGGGGHQDLNKNGCGSNFTNETGGTFNDLNGHGTHVLGTMIGNGVANGALKGMAIGVGGTALTRIRAAKVFEQNNSGLLSWTQDAMDFMDNVTACDSGRPLVINYSGGGSGTNLVGTDSTSRKLDQKSWDYQQLYVISAGNDGPDSNTIGTPAVAKNALTVGNVFDFDYLQVGDINNWVCTPNPCGSSRGPTGDGRMKPNLSAPGTWVHSANAFDNSGYTAKFGTSMAAPHVTGLAATLMHHYADFRSRPYLARAFLMATSILHDDALPPEKNSYGLGRVSAYVAHWARNNPNGWSTHWEWGSVTAAQFLFRDITVPIGATRLVVVMTWDEPAASAGASSAVIDDLDLWLDRNADCTGTLGRCGEYASESGSDNVEYVIINNPPAGTYRLKATPWSVSASRPVGIAAVIIRGDTTPNTTLSASASTTTPPLNTDFTVTTTVSNPSWIASGVHLQNTSLPSGVSLQSVVTTREDGVAMIYGTSDKLTLGNIHESDGRSAVWTFKATTTGSKTISFRSWSENGGTRTASVVISPGQQGCIAPLNLSLQNQTISSSQVFEACNSITVGPNVTITGPNGNITLRAGQKIAFKNGFSMQAGASMKAILEEP